MTSLPQLPNDRSGCHILIEQQQADLQAAKEHVAHLEALLAEHQQTIEDQQQTIKNLMDDNKLLKRNLFGSRRERYQDPTQSMLFDAATLEAARQSESEPSSDDNESEPLPGEPKKKRTSKGRQRRVFPEFLDREEERHFLKEEDIPEPMRNNPNVRRFFKKVGERIEIIPMQLKVIEKLQEVMALDEPDETTAFVSARLPTPLMQSFAGNSTLAYLTVCRFADHLPYYRIEDILGRAGFRIDRSTQWRWMRGIAEGVTPLVDLMWERVLCSRVLGVDETPVKELGGPGRTLTGYLWAGVGDATYPYDCFFYTSDRRRVRAETFLSGFEGYLVADAYVAYERIGELWPGVEKVSCWAHGRRKFEECHHLGATKYTHTAMAYFRRLFDIEDALHASSADERFAVRQEQSKPIVDAFHQWLEDECSRHLPKSKFRGAINYMLNRWNGTMKILTAVMAVLLLMQSTVRAEQSWRFLTLADWHIAEVYVHPDKYREQTEEILARIFHPFLLREGPVLCLAASNCAIRSSTYTHTLPVESIVFLARQVFTSARDETDERSGLASLKMMRDQ